MDGCWLWRSGTYIKHLKHSGLFSYISLWRMTDGDRHLSSTKKKKTSLMKTVCVQCSVMSWQCIHQLPPNTLMVLLWAICKVKLRARFGAESCSQFCTEAMFSWAGQWGGSHLDLDQLWMPLMRAPRSKFWLAVTPCESVCGWSACW